MNIDRLIEVLSSFPLTLEREGRNISKKMAIVGQSLIQDRIQKNGVPGADYSKKYGKIRLKNGRQIDRVDITFTSRMWNGTKYIRTVEQGRLNFISEVGGTDEETDKKIGYMLDLYGPELFDPTQEEKDEVSEIAEDELEELFKNALDNE